MQQHLLLAEAALALPTLLAPGSEPDALQAISVLLQRPHPAAGSGQHGSGGRVQAEASSAGAASALSAPPATGHSPLAVLLAAANQALQSLCASGSTSAVAAAVSTFAQIQGRPNRSV